MRATFRPLVWTDKTTPLSERRSRATFRASWTNTLQLLDKELWNLGAKDVVIQADFRESDIRLDGMPRSNARQPVHPGVRISFDSTHGPLMYQTDICEFWQHNVRSIAMGLEALRAVDRYGITSRAEQYTGWLSIEAPRSTAFATADEALRWLRSEEACGIAGGEGLALKSLLRLVAQQHHPDYGGDPKMWAKYDEAVQLLKKAGVS